MKNDRTTTRLQDLAEPLKAYCVKHRLDISHVVRNGVRMLLGKPLVEPVAKEKRKGEPK